MVSSQATALQLRQLKERNYNTQQKRLHNIKNRNSRICRSDKQTKTRLKQKTKKKTAVRSALALHESAQPQQTLQIYLHAQCQTQFNVSMYVMAVCCTYSHNISQSIFLTVTLLDLQGSRDLQIFVISERGRMISYLMNMYFECLV